MFDGVIKTLMDNDNEMVFGQSDDELSGEEQRKAFVFGRFLYETKGLDK